MGACRTLEGAPKEHEPRLIVGQKVASGMRITPNRCAGSSFEGLDPGIAADPTIRANQGVTTATSRRQDPACLTSGYNYWADATYNTVAFDECVFVSTSRPGRRARPR